MTLAIWTDCECGQTVMSPIVNLLTSIFAGNGLAVYPMTYHLECQLLQSGPKEV